MTETSHIEECPGDAELEAYFDRRPDGRDESGSEVSRHLNVCERCRERFKTIQKDNELVAAVASAHAVAGGPKNEAGSSRCSISIPGYEILSEIQRGGQGVVFRAIQRATKRTVALKVLLQGAFASVRQQQRFEREIDLAAGLQHPRIVTIYDSGTALDGSHFLAMEYIEGVSLGQYMQSKRSSQTSDHPESVNDVLRLFTKVCDAVYYAHQRGIIHRDLKPSNIRIDGDGEPHILDFGLAKVADSEEASDTSFRTLTGEFMGTLAYASPEQTKVDPHLIDVRTDVYSLGVILYEMLTSHLPYRVKGSMAEVLKSIAESDPEPPSSWYRRSLAEDASSKSPYKINNEIETIVLKALTKEKERRYQSVDYLRLDIERYLAGEPIDAKRDSKWYVIQKTVRRHKTPFSMVALFAVMVMGYPFFYSQGLAQELDTANRLVADVIQLVEHNNPAKGRGANPGAVSVLDKHRDRLAADPPRYPRHEAIQRIALGYAYKEYRLFEKAERELLAARSLLEDDTDGPDEDLANAMNKLGDVYLFQGKYGEAESLYQQSLAMLENHFPEAKEAISERLNDIAALKRRYGDLEGAEELDRRALDMRRNLDRIPSEEKELLVAKSLNNLATCLRRMGRYVESADLYRESLDLHRNLGLEQCSESAWVMTGLAASLTHLGEYEEALRLHEGALEIKRKTLGPTNESVANSLHYLAETHYAQGHLDAAQAVCDQALALRKNERVLSAGHPSIADSLGLRGKILLAQQEPEEARAAFDEAVEILLVALGDDHYRTAEAQGDLGACLLVLEDYESAEALLKQSIDRLHDTLGQEHSETQLAIKRMVALYESWGKSEDVTKYSNMLLDLDTASESRIP